MAQVTNPYQIDIAQGRRLAAIAELKAALATLDQPATYWEDVQNAMRHTASALDRLTACAEVIGVDNYVSNGK